MECICGLMYVCKCSLYLQVSEDTFLAEIRSQSDYRKNMEGSDIDQLVV
jgi:hypothetical protein